MKFHVSLVLGLLICLATITFAQDSVNTLRSTGRVITVMMLPTLSAMTWFGKSAAATPLCWSALAAMATSR